MLKCILGDQMKIELELCKYVFRDENIEYIGVLPISECTIINRCLFDRCCSWAKSVIIFLAPYYTGDEEKRNISLYAVPRDYHVYMADLTGRICERLQALRMDNRFRGMSDHSPIAETSAAAAAGLGFIGDNRRLINEKYGSYVFIGEIFTDMETDSPKTEIRYCNHCGVCKEACPSPNECLSALTQQKGELSEDVYRLMKKNNTAWGCDICQSVCPHNKNLPTTPIDFFWKDRIYLLTSDVLNGMSDKELKQRAFGWRKRKTIERNIKLLED